MVEQSGNISVLDLNLSNINNTDILILMGFGLILCIISPLILQKFSREISRLSVFHSTEPVRDRIKNLYWTYLSIMSLLWIFIIISLFSFVSLDNMNILIITLISSSVFTLTIRIMVTTGLIKCSELEKEMNITWSDIRERILSSIYSATVIIVIIAFLGFFIIAILILSGQGNSYIDKNYFVSGKTVISLFTLGGLWLFYPLFLATIGEGLRWSISKIYEPPGDMFVLNKKK